MTPRILRTDPELSTLLIRLALGGVMFPHGAQKLLGWFGGAGFGASVEALTGRKPRLEEVSAQVVAHFCELFERRSRRVEPGAL